MLKRFLNLRAVSFIFLMIFLQYFWVPFEKVLLPPGMLLTFFFQFAVMKTSYEIWPCYFFILHFYIKLSFLIFWDKNHTNSSAFPVFLLWQKHRLLLSWVPWPLFFPCHCRPGLSALLSCITQVQAELSKGVYFVPDGEGNGVREFSPYQLVTHWMYCDLQKHVWPGWLIYRRVSISQQLLTTGISLIEKREWDLCPPESQHFRRECERA